MGHLSRKVRITIRIGTWIVTWNIASSASLILCVCSESLTHQQEDAWVEKEGGRALAGTCWEVALRREMQKVEAALLDTTDTSSLGCLVMLRPACMNIKHILINNGLVDHYHNRKLSEI
jgi:hypothetical protein